MVGEGVREAGVEVKFPCDSSQQSFIDLLLPLGGAVGPQLLSHPQQQSLQVLAAAELHEDPTETLHKPGTLQVVPAIKLYIKLFG